MTSSAITTGLCRFIETFTLSAASSEAREQAAIHVVDTVGVAVAAAALPATRIALEVAEASDRPSMESYSRGVMGQVVAGRGVRCVHSLVCSRG